MQLFHVSQDRVSGVSFCGQSRKAKSRAEVSFNSALVFNLATTYSRRSYTTTTIGNEAFDGRVRNGNGSDHPLMITRKC